MGRKGPSKKLHHPWAGSYKVMKKLLNVMYWIEQLKSKRHRKVVHFDRLNLCPKNIHLDDEPTAEQETSSLKSTMSTETFLRVGHDLQQVDTHDENIEYPPGLMTMHH